MLTGEDACPTTAGVVRGGESVPVREFTGRFERHSRHLPHLEEPGATYFVTCTLRRPAAVDLTETRLGTMVVDALRHFDGTRFWLYDYTVMPDHIHAILKPCPDGDRTRSLSSIMHSIKGWLAHEINRVVGRKGPLWQDETYDHIIRDDRDYEEIAGYILHNPRVRGLVAEATDWPWWGKGDGPV